MFDNYENIHFFKYYEIYHSNIISFIHVFFEKYFPNFLVFFFQFSFKLFFFITLIYLIDIIFYKAIHPIVLYIFQQFCLKKGNILFKHKIINSVSHIISIYIAYQLFPYFFYHHPKSFIFFKYLIVVLFILTFTQFIFRLLNLLNDFVSEKNASYSNIAIRSFVQLSKIIVALFNGFFILSYLFGFQIKDIFTILGTITAVVLLIFRDSILGFVAGIQISSSKMIKVNDWILLPKYNLEGFVREINLITTKIENLDKTLSSVPTYDLISTEVKNYSPMHEKKARQIRRSIYFKIKSFMFLDEKLFNNLLSIHLIKKYLINMKRSIDNYNNKKKDIDNLKPFINGRQLTNIGVFRKYAYEYLINRKDIIQNDLIMIRQLQATPQGLPLEIICFVNDTKLENFELIQSDIFDHLLTSTKEFNLKVSQTLI